MHPKNNLEIIYNLQKSVTEYVIYHNNILYIMFIRRNIWKIIQCVTKNLKIARQ